MKKMLHILVFFFLVSNAHSQVNKSRVDTLLSHFINMAKMPGLSIAVSMGNEVVYSNAFGYSNVETKQPATTKTKYRIGSVTKLFTATAFVDMIRKGKLSPDSKAADFITGLPSSYQNITLSQLASHTSGIRHYTRNEITNRNATQYASLESGLVKFINDTLTFSPGQKYLYSSYGYILLGVVMEKLAGKDFTSIIGKSILKPAKMKLTYPETEQKDRNKSTFYYAGNGDSLTIANKENYSYKWPAGGYLSTPTDLVKFGIALFDRKLVDEEGLAILLETKKTTGGTETGGAYGFRVGTDYRGRKVLHHGGESEGARSFMLFYPKEKLTVALCSSVFRAPLFEGEAETIAGYFLGDYEAGQNIMPAKTYSFKTVNNKKEVVGSMEIKGNKGTIYNFRNTPLPIVDIVYDNSKIRLIATSDSGLINIWLSPNGNGFTGSWGYDKPINTITIE